MDHRCFVCTDCHGFLEADYRWCYGILEEPTVIELDKPVEVERVLRCTDEKTMAEEPSPWVYRDAPLPEGQWVEWLYRTMALSVRDFLIAHQQHHIVYQRAAPVGWIEGN